MIELTLLSTMGLHGVVHRLAPEFERSHGVKLDATFLPTVRLLEQIRGGARGDLAILTADGIDALIDEGVLERVRTDLAHSFVGVAVRAGAPHPDISTPDAFVATLRAARTVAMSKAGASGLFMAGLIERLGLAEDMRSRALIVEQGYTAEKAVSGEADLAIQQVSELLVVPGIELVGRIPPALGGMSLFSAAPFCSAAHPDEAAALLDMLADPARASVYESCGLEPAGTAPPLQA